MKIAETPMHRGGSKGKGYSLGVYIPKPVCFALGIDLGDSIDWFVENDTIIIRKVKRKT